VDAVRYNPGAMKNWRLWVGILVSVLCLYLVARGMDFRSLLAALSNLNYAVLLPASALLALGMWARASRWRLLLPSEANAGTGRLFNLLNISYLVNNISPFRLGDLLRAFLCAELERLSVACTLSTVVVERVADTLAIVTLLAIVAPFIPLPVALLRSASSVGVASLAAALVLLAVAVRREQSLALYDRITARVGILARLPLRAMLSSAADGVAALGSWRRAAGVWLWSLAIWLGTALQFYVVMRGARLPLPFTAALTVLCVTSLGMVVPSSPGYIGVFEYLTVLSLSLFGVSREVALGYALVLHALSYAGLAILGLVAVSAEGYSYAHLRDALNRADSGVSST